jgi:hypothetical protein
MIALLGISVYVIKYKSGNLHNIEVACKMSSYSPWEGIAMSFLKIIKDVSAGMAIATTIIIALPVLGAAGAISATGTVVALGIGVAVASADAYMEGRKNG